MKRKGNFIIVIWKALGKYWFIAIFFATLLVPVYGGLLDANITLSGVIASPDPVEASYETLENGTYQVFLNDTWESEFPGKKFLTKVRNQLLYSVFKVSPNTNVVIGKEGYLFEPSYILYETQIFSPASTEYFDILGDNLTRLQELLAENGKELYVFITPSKARFYQEYIPFVYTILSREGTYSYTNYSKLIDTLREHNICFFDSISFIESNLDSGILESPLFYKSGIHWNHTWAKSAAAGFLDYMNICSRYDLSSVSVKEQVSEESIAPDTDLYSSLNLFIEANEKWYSAEVTVEQAGNDSPNIFLRGGSFMGQSLDTFVRAGIFGEDVYFENNYYWTNQYSTFATLPSFTAYEEVDIDQLMGQSDILVLEVNEAAIPNMSWGFIEYLLEHPEYLDRMY